MAFFKKEKSQIPSEEYLPKHLGIIMDGNGRWAKKRGLPRNAGHSAGASNFRKIAKYCNNIGIKCLTVYAFSTENWRRPQREIDNLMDLFRDYLKDALENFKEENIVTRFVGDLSQLPKDIIELMEEATNETANKTGMILNIAINYGGRQEILHAVKEISQEVISGNLKTDDISEEDITNRLYTKDYPEVDFIIRPSGEYRLSNFLMWQSAYSEFWYSNVLWPDFSEKELNKALMDYANRNRRFGGV